MTEHDVEPASRRGGAGSPFDGATVTTMATGLRFPEGPIALDDGSVLVVEIEGGALTRVAPDGTKTVAGDVGGGPNGAAVGPDGAVYVNNDGGLKFRTEDGIRVPYALADGNEGGSIQRVDLATGQVDTVFTHCDGERILNGNDVVFDETGWCWAVDTLRGVLYYADPVGGTIRVGVEGLDMPNGAGLSPDGTRLYVSETYARRVVAFDVAEPGRATNRSVLHTAEDNDWDGLAVDGAGNVCVSNLQGSGITVIAPDGEVVGRFVTPEPDPFVTNICFGGPGGRTAYVCSSGRGLLYALPWPWPGLRLHFAR